MIIVTGSIRSQPDRIGDLLPISLQHVHRSRLEPGCLLHTVHRDVEDPLTLVFVEHWQDRESLAAHFAVPESGQFVNEAISMSTSAPVINIYEAEPITL